MFASITTIIVILSAITFTYYVVTHKEKVIDIFENVDFNDTTSAGKFALASMGVASSITAYSVVGIIAIFQITKFL